MLLISVMLPPRPAQGSELSMKYSTAHRTTQIDGRTTRHAGYKVSQVIRKLIETVFGDGKQHGATIRQVKLRGLPKVSDVFTLSMLAVNLRRLPRLLATQAMAASG